MSFIGNLTNENSHLNTSRRSPLLRVLRKKAMKKQNSVKNLAPYFLSSTQEVGDYPKKNYLHKKVDLKTKNLLNNSKLNKSNSVTNYQNYCLNSKHLPNDKIPIKRSNINNTSYDIKDRTFDIPPINYYGIKSKRSLRTKSLPNLKNNNMNRTKLKIENDYYCINCYNRKLMKHNNKKLPFKNMNKLSDPNYYHKPIELKQLDENYINNKVLKNQENQLRAFNLLKLEKFKNPKSDKEQLQYINENEDNPFIGLNLQDYLYYKNKKNNEKLNKALINNIDSYEYHNPRKAINDYYKNVQYQIPLLEKNERPSDRYKIKYIEALKKQMSDREKEKKENRRLRIKTEIEENRKYSEFLDKLKKDEKEQKRLKQKMLNDNNKYLEEYQKKANENKKRDSLDGGDDKYKKFLKNQQDYKYFINQQRINEINSLQNWINENKKQKRLKANKDNNEERKWADYNKDFNQSYYDNTYIEKCADCNAISPPNKLYELPKNVVL